MWRTKNTTYPLLESLDIKVNRSFWEWHDTRNPPERPLSKQDGIKTSCASCFPNGGCWTDCKPEALSYRQIPFRFFHSDRCNCGLGYSGHGFLPTLSVQGVVRGGTLGAYSLFPLLLFAPPLLTRSSRVSRELARCIVLEAHFGSRRVQFQCRVRIREEKPGGFFLSHYIYSFPLRPRSIPAGWLWGADREYFCEFLFSG